MFETLTNLEVRAGIIKHDHFQIFRALNLRSEASFKQEPWLYGLEIAGLEVLDWNFQARTGQAVQKVSDRSAELFQWSSTNVYGGAQAPSS